MENFLKNHDESKMDLDPQKKYTDLIYYIKKMIQIYFKQK